MKDKIANITRWILYLLMAFTVVPGILFFAVTIDTETFLNLGYLLLFLSVAVMVISPIAGFITNPQNIVKMLISIAVMVVVIIVAYSIAGNNLTDYRLEELQTTAEVSKLVGMGIYATYITFGLTVVAILYSSIIKLFK